MSVWYQNTTSFQLIDPTNLMAQSYTPGTGVAEKFLSYAFEASSLLAMHGCIPNVKAGLTREHLSVWHTLQPIKKGDRIIIYNASSTIYDNVPKSTRQRLFQQYHNCACDCRACTENWCFDGLEPSKVSSNAGSNTEMVEQIVGELNYIDDEIKKNSRKFKNPDIKTVSRVKDLVVKAWKHCELPSPVIIRAVKLYHRMLGWFYGPSESEWK
ncbi:hypothetical protein QAD02_001278 [Eretmocerus hayati]|uniref:Uncharacterized protein n=1 Tax=Eretmocerus hayati TaxID=131215 RepID=A0ACC2NG03_9HYME|nr:hypothetical protein QAD02_001278 [Eretmocerus hayati]